MARGPKDFSQTAFDIVVWFKGASTADDLATIERATKGAEARKEALTPERQSEIAKTAAAKRWAPQV